MSIVLHRCSSGGLISALLDSWRMDHEDVTVSIKTSRLGVDCTVLGDDASQIALMGLQANSNTQHAPTPQRSPVSICAAAGTANGVSGASSHALLSTVLSSHSCMPARCIAVCTRPSMTSIEG